MLIATYIVMHWVTGRTEPTTQQAFTHQPYINTLPPPNELLTPLHFSAAELELLKGTNLYHATLDRRRDWQQEWDICRDVVTATNQEWGDKFTWFDLEYLHLSWISSRED
jgi:hypothetical protein